MSGAAKWVRARVARVVRRMRRTSSQYMAMAESNRRVADAAARKNQFVDSLARDSAGSAGRSGELRDEAAGRKNLAEWLWKKAASGKRLARLVGDATIRITSPKRKE